MSSKGPPKETKKYYILLEDINVNPREDKIHLAATIWEEVNLFSSTVILVRKYEGEDIGELQEVPVDLLKQIKYEEVHLLLAVPEPIRQRLQIVNDQEWLGEGSKIAVGSIIEVHNVPEIPQGALATVRYKGRLPGRNGTYFGVELHPQHAGKGSTNGLYRRKQLFSCDEDCGLFLSLLRIRYYHPPGARPKTRPTGEGGEASSHKDEVDKTPQSILEIGEKVVWISDSGPERGTVRWLGVLPYSYDKKTIVGVEFDRPIGTGTGKYKGQQLFSCRRNHASLIPMLGLMKLSDYDKSSFGNQQSDSQKVNSFATGNSLHKQNGQREPQEHKEYTDSGYEKGESSKQPPLSRPKHVSQDPRLLQTSSGLSNQVAPNRTRVSAFASGKKPKEDDNSYVPPLLLEPEGKFVNPSTQSNIQKSLQIGDRVSLTLGETKYGTIRWIGCIPESSNPTRVFAGLEMDAEDKIFTSGTWQGKWIFDCPKKKGLFFDLEKCKKI